MMPTTVSKVPLFKRKQRRQEQERAQVAIMERAALEAEEYAKNETFGFLETWLENSIWAEQMEQISITRENLPPLDQLWAFGELDEVEGTRACRRLFKAVVIWDDLGHGLWQMLKSDSRRSSRSNGHQEDYTSAYSSPQRSRGSSPSSVESRCSEIDSPRRSSVTSSIRKGISAKMPIRRATDPQPYGVPHSQEASIKSASSSRSRLHKIMNHGCYAGMAKKSMLHQNDYN